MAVGQPIAQATQQKAKSTKKTAATAPARPARRASIARNPYLGAIVADATTGKVRKIEYRTLPPTP